MSTQSRKNRIDTHKNARLLLDTENSQKYTTSTILAQLFEERGDCSLVANSYLVTADLWIEKFQNYPETEFYLNFQVNDFMVDVLNRVEKYIENTVYPKKRRGRPLLSKSNFRSKRISIYVSDDELQTLETLANQENLPISDLLRKKGLNHKISQKPAKMDLECYSELSRTTANLNQIAKFLNSHPEALIDLDNTKEALKDFRQSLIGVGVDVRCNNEI